MLEDLRTAFNCVSQHDCGASGRDEHHRSFISKATDCRWDAFSSPFGLNRSVSTVLPTPETREFVSVQVQRINATGSSYPRNQERCSQALGAAYWSPFENSSMIQRMHPISNISSALFPVEAGHHRVLYIDFRCSRRDAVWASIVRYQYLYSWNDWQAWQMSH